MQSATLERPTTDAQQKSQHHPTPALLKRAKPATLVADTSVLKKSHKAWNKFEKKQQSSSSPMDLIAYLRDTADSFTKPTTKRTYVPPASRHSTHRDVGGTNNRHRFRGLARQARNSLLDQIIVGDIQASTS